MSPPLAAKHPTIPQHRLVDNRQYLAIRSKSLTNRCGTLVTLFIADRHAIRNLDYTPCEHFGETHRPDRNRQPMKPLPAVGFLDDYAESGANLRQKSGQMPTG
ncbi:MAG: hypothetical protein D6741_21375 [Planctomycetota bacterium]|nr:MAG: hypothetical protein D6741_21375 [Planctomycetota bacterium]